jgi:Protein of unknown function (DUF2510)
MTPPAWYPDPSGSHQLRYWDGQRWTDYVSDQGVTSVAPLTPPPAPAQPSQQVQPAQPSLSGPPQPPQTGGGTVFTEPILVVDRQYSGWDKTLQSTVHDANGRPLATAAEQKPSDGRQVLNMVSGIASLAQTLETKHVMVSGADGRPIFFGDRPNALSSQPAVMRDPGGNEIGRLTKGTTQGRMLDLWTPAGFQGCVMKQPLVTIFDAAGGEVARMTEMPQHSMGFGTAGERYVIHVERPLEGAFGILVIAAILYLRV